MSENILKAETVIFNTAVASSILMAIFGMGHDFGLGFGVDPINQEAATLFGVEESNVRGFELFYAFLGLATTVAYAPARRMVREFIK